MLTQKDDLKMGKENEVNSIDLINKYLETTLKKNKFKYSIFDFKNKEETIEVELKSRRIAHSLYSTAIIGRNKIKYCNKEENQKVKFYICFKYTDGLYIISYNKEIFDKFKIQSDYVRSYRPDVGKVEKMEVVHIPINLLTKID
jgi:hypothetical protein